MQSLFSISNCRCLMNISQSKFSLLTTYLGQNSNVPCLRNQTKPGIYCPGRWYQFVCADGRVYVSGICVHNSCDMWLKLSIIDLFSWVSHLYLVMRFCRNDEPIDWNLYSTLLNVWTDSIVDYRLNVIYTLSICPFRCKFRFYGTSVNNNNQEQKLLCCSQINNLTEKGWWPLYGPTTVTIRSHNGSNVRCLDV
jgi:hypothetical protein